MFLINPQSLVSAGTVRHVTSNSGNMIYCCYLISLKGRKWTGHTPDRQVSEIVINRLDIFFLANEIIQETTISHFLKTPAFSIQSIWNLQMKHSGGLWLISHSLMLYLHFNMEQKFTIVIWMYLMQDLTV